MIRNRLVLLRHVATTCAMVGALVLFPFIIMIPMSYLIFFTLIAFSDLSQLNYLRDVLTPMNSAEICGLVVLIGLPAIIVKIGFSFAPLLKRLEKRKKRWARVCIWICVLSPIVYTILGFIGVFASFVVALAGYITLTVIECCSILTVGSILLNELLNDEAKATAEGAD